MITNIRNTDLLIRHIVGIDRLFARSIGPCDHRTVFDPGKGQDPALDLAEFDTESPDLHLLIDPSEILDIPVREPSGQIACAVHLSSEKRIVYKLFCGKIRTIEITFGDTRSRDTQFTRYADRAHRHMVQDIYPRAGYRSSDRDIYVLILKVDLIVSRTYRSFCRTIGVIDRDS